MKNKKYAWAYRSKLNKYIIRGFENQIMLDGGDIHGADENKTFSEINEIMLAKIEQLKLDNL